MCDCAAKLALLEQRLTALEAKKQPSKQGADWLAELKANPLFAHVDFAAEERKMAIWKMQPKNVNRQITKRFWLNWLAKVDTTVPVGPVVPPLPKAQVKVEPRPVQLQEYEPPPAEFWEKVGRIGKSM